MLHLFIGPMYSGKSTLLLSRFERYKIGGKSCIIIKYDKDIRYDSNNIITHEMAKYSCDCKKFSAINTNLLQSIEHLISHYDVILIDEIQFYKDAATICDKWANQGKIVECYGLSGDFKREPFEPVSKLIPLADSIQHLTAIDKTTGSLAPFTHRLTKDTNQELIGGEEIYQAVSRETFKFMNC